MAATDTDICNLALAYINAGSITDLTDTDEEGEAARLCRLFYTNARDSLLETPFPTAGDSWAFAITRQALAESGDTNNTPWTYMYDLPDGTETPALPVCLKPLVLLDAAALYAELPGVPFVREGTYLYTHLEDAYLKYISQPAATAMPEPFVQALAWRLATLLVKPLNGTPMSDPFAMAAATLREAIAADLHGRTHPGFPPVSWADSRF